MLKFRTRHRLQHGIRDMEIGGTAKGVGLTLDGDILYRAARTWFVNLSSPEKDWPNIDDVFVEPMRFDAIVTRMPISLWTEPDEFISTDYMDVGTAGIICDEGRWHGAFILRTREGPVHLSSAGSRISPCSYIKKVMLVDIAFSENIPSD